MALISHTPGTAYVSITPALQAFYAARGMWANKQPCSTLAGMLGPRAGWDCAYGYVQFFVSRENLIALTQDLRANGLRGLSSQQVAQTLRRFREAAARAGDSVVAPIAPDTHQQGACAAVPFEPLVCPVNGKARKTFERHVMESLHEVITFSQQSIY